MTDADSHDDAVSTDGSASDVDTGAVETPGSGPTRYDLGRSELAELLTGEPGYRVEQVWDGLYQQGKDPAELTNVPKALRARLEAELPTALDEVTRVTADDGATVKFLWELRGGPRIETVLMHYDDRSTVCVSTQAGCAMACGFCATGQAGFERHLHVGEVVEQVVEAARVAAADGTARRVSNIVFMGMGEPLANYNRVLAAVKRIIAPPPEGFGISARSVTVSTVGLAPAIRKLADEKLGVTLAVSLHTPDDELRDTLVPVNNRWPVDEVLDAARYYADVTGRRVSIEYALIRDVNDQPWRADLLGKLLHSKLGPLVHVNLIPLNPTPGSEWDASPKPVEREFVKRVLAKGVSCTVRDTRGREIAAACGQLAAEG